MAVTKCMCTVIRAGQNVGMFEADLMFINGIPNVVFEWEPQPNGSEKPRHLVALDPARLHSLKGWGKVTHSYELPVADPRSPALH